MIRPGTMATMLQRGTPQASRGLWEIESEEKDCWWERQVGVAEGASVREPGPLYCEVHVFCT